MKKYRQSLLLAFILSCLTFATQAQTKEVSVKVGFECDHYKECETGQSRLEKHLMYTKGIQAIKWNPEASTVILQYNSSKTDEQQIKEAIAKAGYDTEGVKADPKAYAKLDACCRKSGKTPGN